jgi:hypothetical protein
MSDPTDKRVEECQRKQIPSKKTCVQWLMGWGMIER